MSEPPPLATSATALAAETYPLPAHVLVGPLARRLPIAAPLFGQLGRRLLVALPGRARVLAFALPQRMGVFLLERGLQRGWPGLGFAGLGLGLLLFLLDAGGRAAFQFEAAADYGGVVVAGHGGLGGGGGGGGGEMLGGGGFTCTCCTVQKIVVRILPERCNGVFSAR